MLLRLYVIPGAARSHVAIQSALALQAEAGSQLALEIIDVAQHPEAAKRDGVVTFPAVVLSNSPSDTGTKLAVDALVHATARFEVPGEGSVGVRTA